VGLLGLGWGYARTGQPVAVQINRQTFTIITHQARVAAILQELGLALAPADQVSPPAEATLAPGQPLEIDLARPVSIEADGQQWQLLTQAPTLPALLAEIGLTLNPRDEVFIGQTIVSGQANLPPPTLPAGTGGSYPQLLAKTTPRGAIAPQRAVPIAIRIMRAIPITLHTGQTISTFYSARPTIVVALQEQGVTLLPGDIVTPAPSTPLAAGMHVFIRRATPVTIQADGQIFEARTQQKPVGQVLAEQGVALMGQDYSLPGLEQPISAHSAIWVVRVREGLHIEEEFTPFETEWVADPTLEPDRREIRQTGATGIVRSRSRVRYEDGQEIWRRFEDEWQAQTAHPQIIAYGTKVVLKTVDTPDGPLEYWRKIPMRATAYNAASSGKPADHPRYGFTSIGEPAGFGLVAVDPKVIPLYTNLYVEKYGPAIAGDTGGRILGRQIDLGYPDGEPLPVIFEWRQVYLLAPAPPADQIRYVLPNWPENNDE
jgi:uncharacterized protein YabE (DUF348 family)